MAVLAILIEQKGKKTVTIPTHNLYNPQVVESVPTIMINDDGTTENVDNPKKVLDSTYFTKTYLQSFIDCAKKYNVSFIMTEVGTDTLDLTPKEYVDYHSTWLKALQDNHIGWMYNCVHGILAPHDLMWLNDTNTSFTEFERLKNSSYLVNTNVMDMLKRYQ
jgi:hypothetical protein